MTLAISHFHAAVICDAVDREEAQIVWRELVFNARIAQPDNQFHAASIRSAPLPGYVRTAALGCPVEQSSTTSRPEFEHKRCRASLDRTDEGARPYADLARYFFSFFSGFSGFSAASAASSPSTSCLPFLMTSGSAGAAAEAAGNPSAGGGPFSLSRLAWAPG